MSLDSIAESIGTVHEEQRDDEINREAADDDVSLPQRDVQEEYDGGFSNDH